MKQIPQVLKQIPPQNLTRGGSEIESTSILTNQGSALPVLNQTSQGGQPTTKQSANGQIKLRNKRITTQPPQKSTTKNLRQSAYGQINTRNQGSALPALNQTGQGGQPTTKQSANPRNQGSALLSPAKVSISTFNIGLKTELQSIKSAIENKDLSNERVSSDLHKKIEKLKNKITTEKYPKDQLNALKTEISELYETNVTISKGDKKIDTKLYLAEWEMFNDYKEGKEEELNPQMQSLVSVMHDFDSLFMTIDLKLDKDNHKYVPVNNAENSHGAMNEVFQYTDTSGSAHFIFKPVLPLEKSKGKGKPIILNTPNMIGTTSGFYQRNIACEKIREDFELLGAPADVVVKLHVAEVKTTNQIGIMMQKAPGIEVRNMQYCAYSSYKELAKAMEKEGLLFQHKPDDFRPLSAPELMQQGTWLQLFHCITGQIDGHASNALFDISSKNLSGIDQDFSFPLPDVRGEDASTIPPYVIGTEGPLPENLKFTFDSANSDTYKENEKSDKGNAMRTFCRPPIIDKKMKEVIQTIGSNLEIVSNQLRVTGLPKTAIEATRSRIKQLATYVASKEVVVIEENQWSSVSEYVNQKIKEDHKAADTSNDGIKKTCYPALNCYNSLPLRWIIAND